MNKYQTYKTVKQSDKKNEKKGLLRPSRFEEYNVTQNENHSNRTKIAN